MPLLTLPPELRSIIFDFCFPPVQTPVQIIPYRTALPACRLNLPLALYLVCKLINKELEPLPAKIRRLDFRYIIQGTVLGRGSRPEHCPRKDDDHGRFQVIMRFAERVRLLGAGPIRSRGRALSSATRILRAGPECALKILEVQPRTWGRWYLARVMLGQLGPLTTHPDVAERLEVRLIRDAEVPFEDLEAIKTNLRRCQEQKDKNSSCGPITVKLEDLDKQAEQMPDAASLNEIEAWLQKFQGVKGDDMQQRAQCRGPLSFD
ncbi:hypothetical protein B0H10DRAFT_1946591 [Mycena sp. CBHHK59/15]|nr:hypothetical protein B0H10DRAFT_1946591 [Mycena sp. CBHHK59/15]